MGEVGFGVVSDVGFDFPPYAFVVADFFAFCTDGNESAEGADFFSGGAQIDVCPDAREKFGGQGGAVDRGVANPRIA